MNISKHLGLLLIGLSSFLSLSSQSLTIKDGTSISYIFKLHGQTRPLNIVVEIKADTVKLNWNLLAYSNLIKGSYLIQPEALKNGNSLNFRQPEPEEVIKLKANETFGLISTNALKSLLGRGYFVYNNTTYRLEGSKDDQLRIKGKKVAVLHVIGDIDKTQMWILNNPDFPLICQILNNPLGIDFYISSID